MKRSYVVLYLLIAVAAAQAQKVQPKQVQLLCHRTANEDVPENTLESLEQAALMGCNTVEIDLRKTLDGKIVLNHDGFLERLTDGIGETEKTYYEDLRLRDAGAWMGERFDGLQVPLFEDALRLARKQDIRLILDMKTKGIGPEVLALLRQEGMLERVRFNGEWDDVKRLFPGANGGQAAVWVQPGVTSEQVSAYQRAGKEVIANFSANGHEMDLQGMKAAVAAGVDAINVDYPRLGADAVGRPVERKLAMLAANANAGESAARVDAILSLSRYRGFPLLNDFAHWLLDPDDRVSRAAALAMVTSRPRAPYSAFAAALRSDRPDARANAAWALGILRAPASKLLPLLNDQDRQVQREALLAMSRMPGEVDAASLLPLLSRADITVRGEAALALARHQPKVALKTIPARLLVEVKIARVQYDDYVKRGKPKLTEPEIAQITWYFRCQIKMVQAISMLKGPGAMQALEELAFIHREDFSGMNELVAAFQLWDRIGIDPSGAVKALGSNLPQVADRAEWILVQGGPAVLPEVRKALGSESEEVRARAIRIVAWQGDTKSLGTLRALHNTDTADADLIAWATDKIASLHSAL
ncbi:MAG TPA: glycerophosphodiester phosphodiesterase family protein [Terracidiphilus sp.]